VQLGELASEGDAVVRAEDGDDVFEGAEDAVRGLVEEMGGWGAIFSGIQ